MTYANTMKASLNSLSFPSKDFSIRQNPEIVTQKA